MQTAMGDNSGISMHFPSVRQAVSMYGEKVESKSRKPTVVETRAALEHELQLAHEDLQNLRQQLAVSSTEKLQALNELKETKELAQEMARKLEAALLSIDVCNNARFRAEQEGEVAAETARSNSAALLTELEEAKVDIEKLTNELQDCMLTSARAATQAREAETVMKNTNQLIMELTRTEAKANEGEEWTLTELLECLKHKFESAEELEQQAATMTDLLDSLRRDLAQSKEEISRLATASMEASSDLMDKKSEIQVVRCAEQRATSALEIAERELESLKLENKKLADEKASTLAVVDILRKKVQNLKQELAATRNAGAITVLTLTTELAAAKSAENTTKTQLHEARIAESNAYKTADKAAREREDLRKELDIARESEALALANAEELNAEAEGIRKEISTISEALREVVKEAGDLKAALEKAKEEAARATIEAENAKEAEEMIQRALTETREAKVEVDLIELQLSEARVEADQVAARELTTSEFSAQKLVDLEQQFIGLRKTLEDKESSTQTRISSAIAEATAARIREQHMSMRLDTLRAELETSKLAAYQASKKAETAEVAKHVIEGELRKWRKAASAPSQLNASKSMTQDSGKIKHIRDIIQLPRRESMQRETMSNKDTQSTRKKLFGTYLTKKKTGDSQAYSG